MWEGRRGGVLLTAASLCGYHTQARDIQRAGICFVSISAAPRAVVRSGTAKCKPQKEARSRKTPNLRKRCVACSSESSVTDA